MTERISITTLVEIGKTRDNARRLSLGPEDITYIVNNEGVGALYSFTSSGSGNTGTAYVDNEFTAIEWGGDPQWFFTTAKAREDDRFAIEAALNNELPTT